MKNNFLINLLRGAFLFTLILALPHNMAFAQASTEGGIQYAAAGKPFVTEAPTTVSSAELEEINTILQSTSRKIALLEAGAHPEAAEEMKADNKEKMKLAKEITSTDYEDDIRKQTLEGLAAKQRVAEEYKKAKAIKVNPGTPAMFAYETPIKYQTQEEIIKSVITDEVLQKKIDLDFDETALGDIIQTISKIANVNIVLDPTLKNNKFDLHLASVSVQEALLLIADSFKLGYKRVGDSLYGTLRDELLKQSETSRVFKLKNINASQAKELLGEMAQKVEISQDLNSLIAHGQPEEIEQLEKALIRLDQPQPQVVLEAKIIEITRDGLRELGIDWADQITTGFQEAGRPATFGNVESGGAEAIKLYSLARNPVQFSATINMLENQNKAKVLSSPSITTLNGKESQIFVGDRIPYTVTNVTGGVATTDVRWVEPGIRLTITPSIIGEDFVVIKVQPEVSFIFAFRGPNSEFPHIKTREATAYVRIKNNEPFILGGLLGQEDKKNLYKVPLLGSIPWLGNLFTNEKTTTSDVELIITITPTIVYGNLN